MPSPFPGMNPYFEQPDVWHDFHERCIPRIADAINAQVGPDYLVKIDEHVYVHELPEEPRQFLGRADVFVSQARPQSVEENSSVAVLGAPVQVRPRLVDEVRESFVEIRDRRDRSLVTVIELLSPANKAGRDREQYITKRNLLLASHVHLVEIDLLRGGERMPFEDPLPTCDYYVMVSRDRDRPHAGLWPIRLRDPLPTIPIPLKEGDADVRLDLQSLVHEIHDAAGYAKYVYETSPVPPLAPDAAAWARQFVADKTA